MAQVMYIDAFAGAAGDMILGAFLDAGLPLAELRGALGSLGLDHELRVTKVDRAGISATHVEVVERGAAQQHEHSHAPDHAPQHAHPHVHEHGHTHDHDHGRAHDHGHAHGHDDAAKSPNQQLSGHHHSHHSLAEITGHINRSALSAAARARAIAMFGRLAEAESAIHATPIDKVHLHEVGALDSIIDIVGAAFAFEWWDIDDVVVSPLNVGQGSVQIAHGTYPVPAPATLRLLANVPVYSAGPSAEMLTPTGALILTTYATAFGRLPAMQVERVGYGAGTRSFQGFPNVLRVSIGSRETAGASPVTERALRIECEIDDMTLQLFGPMSDRLHAAGALDVFLTPVQMKKGRPGTLITVLASVDHREKMLDVLFAETTTIGVRFDEVQREVLARRWADVVVHGQSVRVKIAERGGRIVNAMPEFEDCLRVADATKLPVKTVHAEALRAWHDQTRERPE